MRSDVDILMAVGYSEVDALERVRRLRIAEANARERAKRKSIAEIAARCAKDALESKPYKVPSIEAISVNVPYLESRWGGQGLGRQLPESQGRCYGGDAYGLRPGWAGKFMSVQERLEECKMLVTYFVRCGDFIKIGQSTKVSNRLSQLQVSNPQPLELLLCLPNRMGFREEDLHYRFRNQRQAGEWFLYEGELKNFILEKIKERENPMDLNIRPTPEDLELANCGRRDA